MTQMLTKQQKHRTRQTLASLVYYHLMPYQGKLLNDKFESYQTNIQTGTVSWTTNQYGWLLSNLNGNWKMVMESLGDNLVVPGAVGGKWCFQCFKVENGVMSPMANTTVTINYAYFS